MRVHGLLNAIIVLHLSAGSAADRTGHFAMWVTQVWTKIVAVCGQILMNITILLQACGLQWRSQQKPKKSTSRRVSILFGMTKGDQNKRQDCRATINAPCLQKGADVPVTLTIEGLAGAFACCHYGVLSLTLAILYSAADTCSRLSDNS